MNTIRVNRKSIGINFTARGEAEILIWAPEASGVFLYLPYSNENIHLIKQEYGYWSCITGEVKVGDRYFIQLGNDEKYPDPASLFQPEGIYGPSEIINLNAFEWTDQSWPNMPLENYIFYELHTGAFTPGGTFLQIESKLDYLVRLGITAIELMPVAQFPGARNWGYDGVFPFAVQNTYGGPSGLQHLINTCHTKGLAVVLDVVYNHLGPEGNNLHRFGPYFTDKYKTPWGSAINFDDGGCDAVRKFFIENALMWFRDFHVDALRLDAVHAIKDFSALHILKE
ncbi:MAG: malto-oligosyltrehalose trehalohydrolase, partial [Marivirga sp.]|nr:malto-oligosyltrehalose trehalohydrolase [Marivirga sp.]